MNINNNRAFHALTRAVIISVFGQSSSKRCPNNVTLSDIDHLDGDIIQKGMDMVLIGHRPDLGLESLQQSGFLGALLPDIQKMVGFGGLSQGHKDLWKHTKLVVNNTSPVLETRWAALFHDVGKPKVFKKINEKITFHGHELMSVSMFTRACETTVLFPDQKFRSVVSQLIKMLGCVESYNSDWTNNAVLRLRQKVEDVDTWNKLIDLAQSDCTSFYQDQRDHVKAMTQELKHRTEIIVRDNEYVQSVKPPKGTALIVSEKCKIKGKELGDAMKFLQSSIIEGKILKNLSSESYATFVYERFPCGKDI